MAAAGTILVKTLSLLQSKIRPGVTTADLDAAAEKFIRSWRIKFDVIVPAAQARAVVEAARRAGAVPVSRNTCEITRVEAGVPRFLVDMDTTTIPLEAGIEDRPRQASREHEGKPPHDRQRAQGRDQRIDPDPRDEQPVHEPHERAREKRERDLPFRLGTWR